MSLNVSPEDRQRDSSCSPEIEGPVPSRLTTGGSVAFLLPALEEILEAACTSGFNVPMCDVSASFPVALPALFGPRCAPLLVAESIAGSAPQPLAPSGEACPFTTESPADLRPRLPDYTLREHRGAGPGSTCYAHHTMSGAPVLIRGYATADPAAQSLLGEIQTLAHLSHPGLQRVHGIHAQGESTLVIFGQAVGVTLAESIERGGRMAEDRVLQIGTRLAEALEVAHLGGVLHRTLNPMDVLLHPDRQVHLGGFGRVCGGPGAPVNTEELVRLAYAAPEQLGADARVNPQSDVYGLGAILYHAARGRAPFIATSYEELLHAKRSASPIAVGIVDPNFNPQLSQIIMRMLDRESSIRFSTMREVLEALAALREASQRPTAGGSRVPRHYLMTPGSTGPLALVRLEEQAEAAVPGGALPSSSLSSDARPLEPRPQVSRWRAVAVWIYLLAISIIFAVIALDKARQHQGPRGSESAEPR